MNTRAAWLEARFILLGLAFATSAVGCTERATRAPLPTYVARSDCDGAEPAKLPDGKTLLICERHENGFHWIASQSPADLATCTRNDVLELGCIRGERGRVSVRTMGGDGGVGCSSWSPVCR